mgnify:CR=1 FL=1
MGKEVKSSQGVFITVVLLLAFALVVSYFGDGTGQVIHARRYTVTPVPVGTADVQDSGQQARREFSAPSYARSDAGSGAGVNPSYRTSGQIPQGPEIHSRLPGRPLYTRYWPPGEVHGNHKDRRHDTRYWPPGWKHGDYKGRPNDTMYWPPDLKHGNHKGNYYDTEYWPRGWKHASEMEHWGAPEYTRYFPPKHFPPIVKPPIPF